MPSYKYCPECPLANENGMVLKDHLYYSWLELQKSDKRMFIGNEPVIIRYNSDGMDSTRNMCDGKYYDSKSKFRKITKQYGCIEVGNETEYMMKKAQQKIPTKDQVYKNKKQRREDIKRAVWELNNGRDIKTEVKKIAEEDKRTTI